MAADSCDLLLRAAEMLDHTKSAAAQMQQQQQQQQQQQMQQMHATQHPLQQQQPPIAHAPSSSSSSSSSSAAPFPFPAMMLMGPAPLDPKMLAPLPGGIPFSFVPLDAAVPDISSSLTPARESSPGMEEEDGEDEDGASNDSSMDFGMDGKRARGLAELKASARFNPRDSIAHNSVEKRRRAYLAACYDGLKCSIPALACTRASNVKVLRAGAALIKTLESEDRRLSAEKKRLIAQRDQLIQMNNQLASQLVLRRGSERAVPTLVAAPYAMFAPAAGTAFSPAPTPAGMMAMGGPVAGPMPAPVAPAAPAPVAAPTPIMTTVSMRPSRDRRPSESREVALSLMMLADLARS